MKAFFTLVLIKLVALGIYNYFNDNWLYSPGKEKL